MAFIDDFPVVEMGELAESPEVMPLDWKFQLSGGREIFLTRIQQHRTYGGMLCGLPWDPEMSVVQAISGAQKWDGRFHAAPVVIPATIVSGTTPGPGMPRLPSLFLREWSMLPQVTTFAIFESLKTARDPREVYSSVLVIWWQTQFGIPRDADLLDRLRSIDWVKHAKDWTP
jgi:hypothetical protein